MDVPRLAAEIGYPVMVKVNVGGSGTGMIRYDSAEDLEAAVADGLTPVGVDGVALVQDYVPARGAQVIRCEVLGYDPHEPFVGWLIGQIEARREAVAA